MGWSMRVFCRNTQVLPSYSPMSVANQLPLRLFLAGGHENDEIQP